MIPIEREFTVRRGEGIYIVFLGDFHVGDPNIDFERLEKVVNVIRNSRNIFWIGMGDYCHSIMPHPEEKRFDFDNVDRKLLTPKEQYDYVFKLLHPIRRRCLLILTGNHDEKLRTLHYHDWVDELAERLGVKYTGMSGFLKMKFQRENSESRRTVKIYVHHGDFSGRTTGGKVKRVEEMRHIFMDADIYGMGHVHDIMFRPLPRLYVDENLRVREQIQYFILTGGFERGYPEIKNTSYIEKKMLQPTMLGSPEIIVKPFSGRDEKLEVNFGRIL
ncbi:MAG: hypothetical protein QXX41_07955 [Nitrososphaerota archaeon]